MSWEPSFFLDSARLGAQSSKVSVREVRSGAFENFPPSSGRLLSEGTVRGPVRERAALPATFLSGPVLLQIPLMVLMG